MRALIIPSKDRPATILLTILYNRAGYEVVYPSRESWPNDLCDICVWPVTFMTNNRTGKKISDDISLPLDFGEDSFLIDSDPAEFAGVGHPDACVTVEDIRETGKTIDVFHTTREHIGRLSEIVQRARSLMPYAKWVSSTISDYDHDPFGMKPANVCKILPASYEAAVYQNSFDLVSSEHLKRFLGVKDVNRQGFASFNHNYSVRQPAEFQIFNEVNMSLARDGHEVVPNYGGNTRGQGADIRYSGSGSGFTTLNPIHAAQKNASVLAVVHLKSNDWGGGVPIISISTGTPVIITRKYAERTRSAKYLIDGYNSVWVNDQNDYLASLQRNDWAQMSVNMTQLCSSLDHNLDGSWKDFLDRVR